MRDASSRDPLLKWVVLVAVLFALPALAHVDGWVLGYGFVALVGAALVYGMLVAPMTLTLVMSSLVGAGLGLLLALLTGAWADK
jgi:hypothetical protein